MDTAGLNQLYPSLCFLHSFLKMNKIFFYASSYCAVYKILPLLAVTGDTKFSIFSNVNG